MSSRETINTTKLIKFLMKLNDSEFRMVRHMFYTANTIRDFIFEFKITKEEFCKELCIHYVKYDHYIKGAWNFTLDDISHIQHYIMRKQIEKIGDIDLMPLAEDGKD